MKIENKRETYKIWLQKFVATVIYTPLVLVFSFARYFNQPFYGIERGWLILIVTVIYLSVILYHHLINPYYLYFSDQGDSLVFKYYPIRAFNQKKRTIQVPKNKFVRFEIEKKGLGEQIILYQKDKSGIAKYPPVPLTGLNKNDVASLKKVLSRYQKK